MCYQSTCLAQKYPKPNWEANFNASSFLTPPTVDILQRRIQSPLQTAAVPLKVSLVVSFCRPIR